jgi:thiamine biosynthesis lipoprotein
VESELFGLLQVAAKINKDTGGAFDITVGPLMRAWGFFRGEGRIPGTEELGKVLENVGQHHVLLDADNYTVRFDSPNVEIDLGGIAKGYGLDQAVEVLKQHGIDSALVDGGTSSIYALGAPPGEEGWPVGIRDPMNKTEHLETITLRDAAISTSGNLEKFFEIDGKVYGHIMDLRTGMPIQGVLSASAIAPTGTESDALSTAFFVMGEEGTKRYCETHPGVKAILVVQPEREALPRTVRFGFE